MSQPAKHSFTIQDRWHLKLVAKRDEKWAAQAVMNDLAHQDHALFTKLCTIATETTFHVRRYPNHVFYSWPQHPIFQDYRTDPWPASRWPQAVLCIEIAKVLNL